MIDTENSFTDSTGVAVNLKLVTGGTLLPSILSRKGPDVYIGLGAADVINYAIREAVLGIGGKAGSEHLDADGNPIFETTYYSYKDENGKVVEIHCTADLEAKNGMPADGRKIKGTIHWISAENADKVVAMTAENGVYSASSDEIAAKYLDKTLYVAAVYQSNGVTYCSGVLPYSIAAYCRNVTGSVQNLATAAAIYGCAAKQYFGV